MRISDWSSDVCSSDLVLHRPQAARAFQPPHRPSPADLCAAPDGEREQVLVQPPPGQSAGGKGQRGLRRPVLRNQADPVDRRGAHTFGIEPQPAKIAHGLAARSEEHTSELQSLMRISYAVFCLKKKKKQVSSISVP